jgi:hypothetical protein
MNVIETSNSNGHIERKRIELLGILRRKMMNSIKHASTAVENFENHKDAYPETEAMDLVVIASRVLGFVVT